MKASSVGMKKPARHRQQPLPARQKSSGSGSRSSPGPSHLGTHRAGACGWVMVWGFDSGSSSSPAAGIAG
eukprot:273342-Chlamydomonas_euryale.AAC.9